MKIVQAHNYYQQAGGEDSVVEAERDMLRDHGHVVIPYYKNNESISGIWQTVVAGIKSIWNWNTYSEFRRLLRAEKPDLVHCHNTFPLISPSIYWACAKENVPVIQTLHNYRLLCLNAILFRDTQESSRQSNKSGEGGRAICELCVSKRLKWPGIKYRCYRSSMPGSLIIAVMLLAHELISTWSTKVTAYIALTEFHKAKLIEGGVPAGKISVKPNFVQGSTEEVAKQGAEDLDPDTRSLDNRDSPYCLFVGRLSREKGCDLLIRAWAQFQEKLINNADEAAVNPEDYSLLIVGDGPEQSELEQLSAHLNCAKSVHFIGRKPKESVLFLMKNARFLVFPSVWYETFGLTVLEAGLSQTPSIVSAPTATSELVKNWETGLLYPSGNEQELAKAIDWAFRNPQHTRQMGKAVFREFEKNYSAEVGLSALISVYEQRLGLDEAVTET